MVADIGASPAGAPPSPTRALVFTRLQAVAVRRTPTFAGHEPLGRWSRSARPDFADAGYDFGLCAMA